MDDEETVIDFLEMLNDNIAYGRLMDGIRKIRSENDALRKRGYEMEKALERLQPDLVRYKALLKINGIAH